MLWCEVGLRYEIGELMGRHLTFSGTSVIPAAFLEYWFTLLG